MKMQLISLKKMDLIKIFDIKVNNFIIIWWVIKDHKRCNVY